MASAEPLAAVLSAPGASLAPSAGVSAQAKVAAKAVTSAGAPMDNRRRRLCCGPDAQGSLPPSLLIWFSTTSRTMYSGRALVWSKM